MTVSQRSQALTLKGLERLRRDNALRLAFIGMSNIGKSYTAQRLSEYLDITLIEVDSLIAKQLGQKSLRDFAAWQGQPFEPGYAEREARSLELESQATLAAIDSTSGNLILDTPGSVIYTQPSVIEALKSQFWIVYIRADEQDMERLKRDYYDNPKPLVWAEHFKAQAGLSDTENIMDSYPNLLEARAESYAALAHLTLEARFILNPETSPEAIFKAIASG